MRSGVVYYEIDYVKFVGDIFERVGDLEVEPLSISLAIDIILEDKVVFSFAGLQGDEGEGWGGL